MQCKQSDTLISTGRQDKTLLIIVDALDSLLFQLLQSIDFCLLSELVFQKLTIHQLRAKLTLQEHNVFNDIFMGKKPVHRSFLLNVPHDNTLIIRAGNECFTVCRNHNLTDPTLMACECSLAKSGRNLP